MSLGAVLVLTFLGAKFLSRESGSRQPAQSRSNTAGMKSDPEADKRHERKMLLAALEKKPDHAPLLFRLAQLAGEAGERPAAAKYLRQVLQYEPNNSDALLELGKVLYETGDVAGALANTKKILEREPDHPGALLNLGALRANAGDYSAAREYWNRLVSKQPASEQAGRAREMLKQLPASPH